MKKALYAGSFDPLTFGHLSIIEQASKLFDELDIAVVVNMEKKSMFTYEERINMILESTKHLKNIKVTKCEGLLADFVNSNGYDCVVRGLRNNSDFDSEQSMAYLHNNLYNDGVSTVFFLSSIETSFISSTMAKQVISLGGDGTKLVPQYVLKYMKGKIGN